MPRPQRLLTILLLLAPAWAWAAAGPASRLPDQDAYAQAEPWAVPALRLPPGARAVAIESKLGVPRLLLDAPGAKAAGLDPEAAARAHLDALRGAYRLQDTAFDALEYAVRPARGDRPLLVVAEQRFEGAPVLGARLTVTMRPDRALVAVSGFVSPNAPAALERGAARWERPAAEALALARRELATVGVLRPAAAPQVRPVWYLLPDALEPAWLVEASGHDGERSHGHAWVMSARDGRLLARRDLLRDAAYSYRAWAAAGGDHAPMDGPQGDAATPHPTGIPDGFLPPPVTRESITLASSSHRPTDPWLPDGAVQLDGNNVFAYADRGPDGFDGGDVLGSASSASTFDHPYDPALDHAANASQVRAALTQGFYVINWLHDWFYAGGFVESLGNHQQSNFGRGGQGGDPLLLEGQDAAVFDNANAWAPSDGGSPVIQMGVWSGDTARSAAFSGSGGFAAALDRATTGGAQFGPQSFAVSGQLRAVSEVEDASGDPLDGCDPPYIQAAQIVGRIALLQRGNCFFIEKARAAQAAGAIALVVINQFTADDPAGGTFTMALPDGEPDDVTIPVLLISNEDGMPLRTALATETITATLARTAGPSVDSTLDTHILTHEWGHVLNNRLMTVGSTTGTQPDGMDEGYADFVALLVNVGAESGAGAYTGAYPMGPYSAALSDDQGYYFGIRRYPYSTDLTKNPLTFQHIADGVALPSGPPRAPSGASNTEVHNVGEVWAVMLWECYTALLRDGRYSYTQARERMRDYLVDAQLATPGSPDFVEARDAWLAVAAARDATDRTRFATAFAKRGLGEGAVAPSHASATNAGVVEGYTPVPAPVSPPPPPPGGGGGGGGATDLAALATLLAATLGRGARRRQGPAARR